MNSCRFTADRSFFRRILRGIAGFMALCGIFRHLLSRLMCIREVSWRFATDGSVFCRDFHAEVGIHCVSRQQAGDPCAAGLRFGADGVADWAMSGAKDRPQGGKAASKTFDPDATAMPRLSM